MNRSIVFRAEAETEFDEAFDWYDSQQVGLGVSFAAAIQATLDAIAANPLIHSVVFADIRKSVVPRFPYCVVYRPHAVHVEVIAVFHTSRDPSVWQIRA